MLSIKNYGDERGGLPPLVDQGEHAPTGEGFQSLLSFIEQYMDDHCSMGSLKERLGYCGSSADVVLQGTDKEGNSVEQRGGVANQVLRVYLDPADTTARQLRDVAMTMPDGATGYYATGSYAANSLIPWGENGDLQKLIPDGTAYTVMFAERPQVCRTAAGETVYNLWGLGFYSPHMPAFATLTPEEPAGLQSTGQVAPITPLLPRNRFDAMQVRVGRTSAPPRAPAFSTPVQIVRGKTVCDPRLPGSPHAGVIQCGMADGSVHVFAHDVHPWVFWAACTPNGDEYLKMDW
jgi:hypothetical protein